MDCRNLTDATDHSGGVVATARWQGCAEQLEKPSSPRREIGGAKRSRITATTGSRWKGERVTAGSVVAMKRSNVRGAKRPCCLCWLQQQGRQGGCQHRNKTTAFSPVVLLGERAISGDAVGTL